MNVSYFQKGRYLYDMYFVLLFLLLIAAVVDLTTKKIPNQIVLCGILSGMLCRFFVDGYPGIFVSISGIFLPSVLLLLLYQSGIIGAGDVKLMSAAGSFLGVHDAFGCLLPILFFAGGFSFIYYLFVLFQEKKDAFHKFHVIPMAVPVFLGIFWYLCKTGAV